MSAVVLEILFSFFIEMIVYVVFYTTGAIVIRLFSLNKLKPRLRFNKKNSNHLDSFDWFYLSVIIGVITWVLFVVVFWIVGAR